jgi:AraC-like DNA-binding protein
MNVNSFINYILIAGVIQGFGFNLVTLFIKKKISKVIFFLNLIVLFLSLNNLQRFLIDINCFNFSFLLKHLQVPWYFCVLPMFYAFTVYFLSIEKNVNDFIKVSIIIFILEIIIRLILISFVYYNIQDRDVSTIKSYTIIEEIFNLIYGLFLFIKVCFFVFKKNWIQDNILGYDDLNWLKWFIKLNGIAFMFWILSVVMYYVFTIEYYYDLTRLYVTIIMYWLGYQGFYRYNVVQDRVFLRGTLASNKMLISSKHYFNFDHQKDDIYNEKHRKDFDKIMDHIIKNKLYLNPLLSMESTANELGMSKSYFSKLINSYSNYNFSDFINSLRVEQAKKFLSNDEFSQYTIVAIGLECGFNSKSTFYSAFKKFTSETPSTFREQN